MEASAVKGGKWTRRSAQQRLTTWMRWCGVSDMVNEEIQIRFKWTVEEMLRAMRAHFSARYGAAKLIASWLLCVALFGWGFWSHSSTEEGSLGLTIEGAMLLVLIILPLILPFHMRRIFSKRPDKDLENEWRITPEGFVASNALGQSTLKWEALAKVVKTPAGYLLYPMDHMYYWLPRSAFVSVAAYDRVGVLAEACRTAR